MNKHIIVNLKCPCFLFRYPNLDIPSQALFNLHRASAFPLIYFNHKLPGPRRDPLPKAGKANHVASHFDAVVKMTKISKVLQAT